MDKSPCQITTITLHPEIGCKSWTFQFNFLRLLAVALFSGGQQKIGHPVAKM
jgi:hypothetical protein